MMSGQAQKEEGRRTRTSLLPKRMKSNDRGRGDYAIVTEGKKKKTEIWRKGRGRRKR